MKKRLFLQFMYGLSATLLIWSLTIFSIHYVKLMDWGIQRSSILGILAGIGLCSLITARDSYFSGSSSQIKRGLIFGTILGLIGGVIFMIVTSQNTVSESNQTSQTTHSLLLASRWLILTLCFGIAAGLNGKSSTMLARGIVSGIVSGLFCIAISYFVSVLSFVIEIGNFINMLTATLTFLMIYEVSKQYGKKTWIKSLNGKLEGYDFELTNDIHFLGTQYKDDINLNGYPDVNQTHAKLVRYLDGYSLIDNDPFSQTYVNFRNINEQPLKSGDILKIGRALFQFCNRLEPQTTK